MEFPLQNFQQRFNPMAGDAATMQIAKRDRLSGAISVGALAVDKARARDQVAGRRENARVEQSARVSEPAAELLRTNRELQKQVQARERTLVEKSQELAVRARELEESHIALRALLKEFDKERRRVEQKMVSNLNDLVRPQLARLTAGNLSPRQRALIAAIEKSLDDIASPSIRRLAIEARGFTPSEIQVANQIRQGKSTKAIADLMGVACSTVDYHRLNIRRKLKLTNQSVNLQTYLQSTLC